MQSLGNGTAFRSGAFAAARATPINPKYSGAVFRLFPPAPNTWTLNILPLWSVPPRTSAFCQPDPHCLAVLPACHIPLGKLLWVHNSS